MADRDRSAQPFWKRPCTVPWPAAAGVVLLVVLLLLILWSVKRRRDVHLYVVEPAPIAELIPSLAGLTHGTLVEGNRVEVLENGDGYFPPLLADLGRARETIHFENFLWEEGSLSQRIVEVLAERAGHGVEVRVLLDASGGREIADESVRRLRDAGAQVEHYHPISIAFLGSVNNRDHRKLVVIDGRIGYIGGHCVVDSWLGDTEDREHFRDVSVRVRGPVVHQLQSAFTENWVEQVGEVVAGERYFPAIEPAGPSRAHLAYVSPAGSTSSVELLYYLAISSARRRILIQNPYFLPDPDGIDMLQAAARRGVRVRVMLPSAVATDNAIVQHASHHHFGTLLKAGVEVYEYDKTLLHQKTLTIDGVWSAVGSTNFDDRSFELNDEATLGIADPEVAQRLEAIFEEDLAHCRQIRLEEWKHRSLWHKLLDGGAYLINEQL
jgi:cardiolipin synthase